MKKDKITIGLDLGGLRHTYCVLDGKGEVVKQGSMPSGRNDLATLARSYPGAVAVMEAGMQSPWVSRHLESQGLKVIVANPRKVRAIYQNERKCDERDAEMLARIGRLDVKLLHPIEHGSEQAQQDSGVGPITALYFVLKIGDPARFSKARDVGAFLGLCPRRDQSGDTDKEMRISKYGDAYLRRLLVSAAPYVLGPFGAASALRSQGLKMAAEETAKAKKRAVIAVARKLAVLLLTLWKRQEAYEAFPAMA